jgi:hypothetical protein
MHKDDCQHQAQNSRQGGDVDGSNQAKADHSQANNGHSEQHEPAYQPTHLGTSARRALLQRQPRISQATAKERYAFFSGP